MTTVQMKVPNWLDFIFACPLLACRLLRYGYTYRKIYVGQNQWTIVDLKDYYRLGNTNWYLVGRKTRLYAAHNVKSGDTIIQVRLHRDIMNAPPDLFVDHINGNGLDNRRANLRLATHTQNMHNCRKRKNTTSQYIGVHFDKKRNRWATSIMNDRKKLHLGRFKTELEAARAYDKAAIKYRDEFAKLNFPREDYKDEFLLQI